MNSKDRKQLNRIIKRLDASGDLLLYSDLIKTWFEVYKNSKIGNTKRNQEVSITLIDVPIPTIKITKYIRLKE